MKSTDILYYMICEILPSLLMLYLFFNAKSEKASHKHFEQQMTARSPDTARLHSYSFGGMMPLTPKAPIPAATRAMPNDV